jgi:hypothetical protein
MQMGVQLHIKVKFSHNPLSRRMEALVEREVSYTYG